MLASIGTVAADWDQQEQRLQHRARRVRATLDLDAALAGFGQVQLIGSAAMRVMVARDVDLVVTVSSLTAETMRRVAELAGRLTVRPDVHTVTVRDETGRWNSDSDHPDGIYLFIEYVDELDDLWTVDVWVVDEPGRKPALRHLAQLAPRINPETQAAILAIKRATGGRRSDGSRLPSFEIYRAVLDDGVRTPAELDRRHR